MIGSYVSDPIRVIRVIRGGCWSGNQQFTWVADRSYGTPDRRYVVLGVRLVRRCI
jgi:formylglycine-generating enzyme required for sulfatase activity